MSIDIMASTAENILERLKELDRYIKNEPDLSNTIEAKNETDSESVDDDKMRQEEGKIICRLCKIHLPDFYDNIYIPFSYFKFDEWEISKVIYNNEDALFYNKKYLVEEDESRFNEVFDKYTAMIEEIMSVDSKLLEFLKKWTNMDGIRWRSRQSGSYLKSVFEKYAVISPVHIANTYLECFKKYSGDRDKIIEELEGNLDSIIKEFRRESREFRRIYNDIVGDYVYDFPFDKSSVKTYKKGFINSVIIAIWDFSEKLIDLNIYAVHPIIANIIEFYIPLDDIFRYSRRENKGKRLCII